jgi:6-phosphofructokinase 1
MMGAYAADILIAGKTNRVVGIQNGQMVDLDMDEALAMKKNIDPYQVEISTLLSK